MPFQTTVSTSPAPAVWGDFADTNPRFTFPAGPGGLVAGAGVVTDPITLASLNGVVVGRFAWATASPADPDGGPTLVNSTGVGVPSGFVHREEQAIITGFLKESTMIIPQGLPVILYTGGGFWAKNEGTTEAVFGQKAYVAFANGAVNFAATASATTTASTTSTVVASTFSVSGYLVGNTLTILSTTSGTIVNGATISGTSIATGTQIVAQLSGTAGGVGVYSVSIPEQSAGTSAVPITVSGTYGTLTLGGAPSNGAFVVGGLLTGGTVVAGTQITQLLTGTGGAGSTFAVNNNTASTSATLTETLNVETKFFAFSSGLAGELVKISDHGVG